MSGLAASLVSCIARAMLMLVLSFWGPQIVPLSTRLQGHGRRSFASGVWCGRRVIPEWQHIAWDCEYTAQTRPRIPTDPLQLRLGWATHADTEDFARRVLLHLAKVRALALHSW